MNMTPDGGGGSGSSGGPNEQQLFLAAFGASSSQINAASDHVRTTVDNLNIVTEQLDKLVPQIRDAWPSADGDVAASSTRELYTTLSTKKEQLGATYTALNDARSAVKSAQDYWSNRQPPPTPPTQPAAPTTTNSDVPDIAAIKQQSQYREDKATYDSGASAREEAMHAQYVEYQKNLDQAGQDMARVNSVEVWDVGSGGSVPGGSGHPVHPQPRWRVVAREVRWEAARPVVRWGAARPVVRWGAARPVVRWGAAAREVRWGAARPVARWGAPGQWEEPVRTASSHLVVRVPVVPAHNRR